MAKYTVNVNGEEHVIEAPSEMPLLWAIRDLIGLTGTKFGCGMAQCGSCTVQIDGRATYSCSYPIGSVGDRKVTTIEGLSSGGNHPLQLAWIAEDVPQCGYCQSGQIMRAATLLEQIPNPSDDDIDEMMSAVICRCGTYDRIRKAIHRAAKEGGTS